ncbi:M23 family metallopeptidase [Mucilaginibacter sp. Bleaf8]|uniref:M23 family metallopeptidase n=1 Tax=Mucilaginibacter sp. Bleaf8 TaxID=2834430 RepID=UPI001BCF586B|nr:M23 family metallopeptidase [Mucilaginibacter sp. Bleaf8]MBS7563508.1 M23 family metallopeptidase [Mucilaginibacter sp. Bleaf8]
MSLFKKLSPHDAYAQRLKDAGLDRTAMGGAWLQSSNASINRALSINIPYKETGYFAAEKTQATALRFDAQRGQKLHIAVLKRPQVAFDIYIDLLQELSATERKLIASVDTTGTGIEYEVKQTGRYILRLQPELLRGGEYTLTITAGPSLNFPVSSTGKPNIGSFWGDGRDEGARRHEGVDIFASKHTPALAAADGIVTNVTENKLGGLVVFLHPNDADYTLYYAHLDKQLVQNGQAVHTGDTVGLVGNTGNARTTPPHLHFGIYANGGAINPLPFVNREIKAPKPISAPLQLLNATARTTGRSKLYAEASEKAVVRENLPVSTALTVEAATDGWYKAALPNGTQGYISSRDVALAGNLRKLTLKSAQPLWDAPDTTNAARKTILSAGDQVNIKAAFKNYFLVIDDNDNTGWIPASR